MANFKRKRPRQRVCSPASSRGRLGNAARGTKCHFVPENEQMPSSFGPARDHHRKYKRQSFVVMARYIGPKRPGWDLFHHDRGWHRWGRYKNRKGAEQAMAASVRSYKHFEFQIEEIPNHDTAACSDKGSPVVSFTQARPTHNP